MIEMNGGKFILPDNTNAEKSITEATLPINSFVTDKSNNKKSRFNNLESVLIGGNVPKLQSVFTPIKLLNRTDGQENNLHQIRDNKIKIDNEYNSLLNLSTPLIQLKYLSL